MSPRENALVMWTIYDHPKDYPDAIVARRFEVYSGAARATTDLMRFPSVHAARNHFARHGLTRMLRDPSDDPVIVETWL